MELFSIKFVNIGIKILLMFLIVLNIGAGFFLPLMAIFITEHIVGATLVTVGIATAIYSGIKSGVQIPLAKLLDKEKGEGDDYFYLITGSLITVIYFFAIIYISEMWQLYTLQFILGIGDAFLMAAYYSIFSHHIDKNSEGFEWSLLSVGGLTLSTAIGGLIGSIVAQEFGFTFLFLSAGTVSLFALIIILLFLPKILILESQK